MNVNKILFSTLAIIASLALFSCASSHKSTGLAAIKEKGRLVVATNPDYAPFEFQTLIDGKNRVVGADMELAQAIADELGVKLEISTMSFNNVLSSVQSGRADIAISGLSVTSEREKVFDFSDSYYETENSILIKKSELDSYSSLKDFTGKKVAVLKGSIEEGLAQKQLSNANVISLPTMGEAINELKDGQVDAVDLEGPVALGFATQNSDLAQAKVALVAKEGAAKAVAMKKDQKELLALINKVIKKVRSKGDYDNYIKKAVELTADK